MKDTPRSGSSRRKPVVTRKVVESEEDLVSGDEDQDVASPSIEYEEIDSPKPSTSKSARGQNCDDMEDEPIDVDEHGNFILPEGTVVVEPEAVEDNMPIFRGPEFKARKHRADGLDRLACTACNKQINPNGPGAIKRHPVLKVLICKKCYNWYTSDEIDQDSNGIDEQCRWCGEGGNLICCDYCHNAFCKGCIKRNLGRAELSSIIEAGEDLKWQCYVCDQKPLTDLIGHCTKVLELVEKSKGQGKDRQPKVKGNRERRKSKKNMNTSQSEDSEVEIDESNAEDVLESLTATTQSMQMLLESMKEESLKGKKKGELADKLRRSVLAFKRSVLDIGKSSGTDSKQDTQVNGGSKKQEDTGTTETDGNSTDDLGSSSKKTKESLKLKINVLKQKNSHKSGGHSRNRNDTDSEDEDSDGAKRKHRKDRGKKKESSENEESGHDTTKSTRKENKKKLSHKGEVTDEDTSDSKKRPAKKIYRKGRSREKESSDDEESDNESTKSTGKKDEAKKKLSHKGGTTDEDTTDPKKSPARRKTRRSREVEKDSSVDEESENETTKIECKNRKGVTDDDDISDSKKSPKKKDKQNSTDCHLQDEGKVLRRGRSGSRISSNNRDHSGDEDLSVDRKSPVELPDSSSDMKAGQNGEAEEVEGDGSEITEDKRNSELDNDIPVGSKDDSMKKTRAGKKAQEKDKGGQASDSNLSEDMDITETTPEDNSKRKHTNTGSESEPSAKRKRSRDEPDPDTPRSTSKRSRADIEAQRILHKELLEDSDDSADEEGEDSSDELESSDEEDSDAQSSGDEYNPKQEVTGGRGVQKRRSKRDKRRGRKKQMTALELLKAKREAREKKKRKREKEERKERKKEKREMKKAAKKEKEMAKKSKEEVESKSNKEESKQESEDDASLSKSKGEKKKNNSDAGSDTDTQTHKKRKHSSDGETKGKASKAKKKRDHQSDSSNYDSELEEAIDKLANLPQIKMRKKTESKGKTDDDKQKDKHEESGEDTKTEGKEQEKEASKEKEIKRKGRKPKKDLVEELGSGDDSEDEGDEVDEAEEEEKEKEKENGETKESDVDLIPESDQEDEDMKARKDLLADSDEESDKTDAESDSDIERRKKKQKDKKTGKKAEGDKEDKKESVENEDSDSVTKKKKPLRRTILLDAPLSDPERKGDSDSDSDIGTPKKRRRRKKKEDSDKSVTEESESESEDDSSGTESSSMSSDEVSDSDFESKKKGKKGKKSKSKQTRKGKKGKKGKGKGKKGKKRKRIKVTEDSSEGEKGSGDSEDDEDPETPGKKRKDIRKIMKDKKLADTTKAAAQAEEDRRKRIAENQKKYNQVTEEDENSPTKCPITTKLVLESNKDGKPIIEVHPDLIRNLKPHQVEAVKFLWDSCVESLERMKKEGETGGGCILAHCMGLGKTLSVITFVHTCLKYPKKMKMKTCLVVCPLNTVLNWKNEWEKWLDEEDQLDVYELSSVKDNWSRADMLQSWQTDGGIMLMGYEMYRNLVQHRYTKNKKQKKIFTESLVDPGPDLVVCDEGHILKNDGSAISKAMNMVKSRRRIALTGTPLQNNLVEYHCMVSFVKPNLLGTRKEFLNRFVNPITNGQCADSTLRDVKVMKKRAHILHETLNGCVQRRDYSALTKFLPPKHEYVIAVRLSPVQCTLYQQYLERAGQGIGGQVTTKGARLFSDYQGLMRIWTHPWVMRLGEIRDENKKLLSYDDEDSFVDDESYESEASMTDKSDGEVTPDEDLVMSGTRGRPSRRATRGSQQNNSNSDTEESDHDRTEVVKDWKTRSRGGMDGNDEGAGPSSAPDITAEPQFSTEWWAEHVKPEDQFNMELSGKITLLAEVLRMSESIGDKVLVFSQSLLSLDLIEDYLEHWDKGEKDGAGEDVAGIQGWTLGADYFRMDGSTSVQNRSRWSDSFNDPENPRARLFLISTRAGSLGINLIAANRVIIFDASWNPSHDIQSIFRVYRFGQEKPVYVYRFLAQGTMEEKIYERQVTKQSLSQRVIDEHQIDRHFNAADLQELYNFTPERLDDVKDKPTPTLPKDLLLAELLTGSKKEWLVSFHEHDSLLENREDEGLTEEERKAAWEEYEAEKKGLVQAVAANIQGPRLNPVYDQQGYPMGNGHMHPQMLTEFQSIARAIYAAHPGISGEELQQRISGYIRLRMANSSQYAQQQLQMQEIERRQREEVRKLQQIQEARMRLERQQQMYGVLNQGAYVDQPGSMSNSLRNLMTQANVAQAQNRSALAGLMRQQPPPTIIPLDDD